MIIAEAVVPYATRCVPLLHKQSIGGFLLMNIKAKGFKRFVSFMLIAAMATQAVPAVLADETAETPKVEQSYAPSNSLDEMAELLTSTTYEEYLTMYDSELKVLYGIEDKKPAAEAAAEEGAETETKEISIPVEKLDRPVTGEDLDPIAAASFDPALSDEGVIVLKDPDGILKGDKDPGDLAKGINEYALTPEDGKIGFTVEIPKTGYYNVRLTYFPFVNLYYDANGNIVAAPTEDELEGNEAKYNGYNGIEGNTVAIERVVMIDGVVPFKEARNIAFTRVWKDAKAYDKDGNPIEPDADGRAFRKDISFNEIRSKKYEAPEWREHVLRDSNAFYTDSFKFFLEEGTHTLQLDAAREPVILGEIQLFCEEKLPTYAEYLESVSGKPAEEITKEDTIKLQAEVPVATSDQVIYPVSDKTSSITEPHDTAKTLVNTIGGDKWQIAGQWISYEFDCEKSGFYYIVPRAKQAVYAGIFASRALKINGEYPFEEAKYLQFNFSEDWQTKPLNDNVTYTDPSASEGPIGFKFYFEAGKHYTLEFECVLGNLSDKLRQVDDSLTRMNDYYRQILMITGPEPDSYTDYEFTKLIPDVLRGMRQEAANLYQVSADLEAIIGEKGQHSVLLDKVAYTLEIMGNDQNKIADNLSVLKSYIGSIGTWLLQSRNQPLQVDYLAIQGTDVKLPRGEAGFFSTLGFEIGSFFASFTTDYNTYGAMTDFSDGYEGESVEVWLTTGRDQAQIMREMVDDFTEEAGIAVNYKLVAAGTLLPATLAGIGPDVSTDADATGFGVRNAVKNLAAKDENGNYIYEGFDKVRGIGDYEGQGWFNDEAWAGLTVYNPDDAEKNPEAVYGVPVTQSFNMLFYRKDIFVELGLEVPESWDDIYQIIRVLSDNNMSMGFSQGMTQIIMYQKGEPYYKGDGDIRAVGFATNLDSNTSLDAFQQMCELFTMYSQPVSYDFANRFRTGEMPVGIADYSLCNQLLCFAPEIKGLWEFVRLPGSFDSEGKFSAVSPTGVSAIMIMGDAKNDKNAWEYIKWWVGEEAQERFGKEQVAIMGAAAKYNTANVEALKGQPWSAQEKINLIEQFDNLMGTPMTPGNYILARYTNFAFLDVYNDGDAASDAMLYYIDEINKEITRKRAEYDFPTEEELLEAGIIDEEGNLVSND